MGSVCRHRPRGGSLAKHVSQASIALTKRSKRSNINLGQHPPLQGGQSGRLVFGPSLGGVWANPPCSAASTGTARPGPKPNAPTGDRPLNELGEGVEGLSQTPTLPGSTLSQMVSYKGGSVTPMLAVFQRSPLLGARRARTTAPPVSGDNKPRNTKKQRLARAVSKTSLRPLNKGQAIVHMHARIRQGLCAASLIPNMAAFEAVASSDRKARVRHIGGGEQGSQTAVFR